MRVQKESWKFFLDDSQAVLGSFRVSSQVSMLLLVALALLLAVLGYRLSVTSIGTMVGELWTNFGIETTVLWSQDNGTNYNLGQFDVNMGWNIESWGGNPDLSFFADSLHSKYNNPIGFSTPAATRYGT